MRLPYHSSYSITSGPCQRSACHAHHPQLEQRLFCIPDASGHFEAVYELKPDLLPPDLEILVVRLATGRVLFACKCQEEHDKFCNSDVRSMNHFLA